MTELSLVLTLCRALQNCGAPSNLIQSSALLLAQKLRCSDFRLIITSDAFVVSAIINANSKYVELENKSQGIAGGSAYTLGRLLGWLEDISYPEKTCNELQRELFALLELPRPYPRLCYHFAAALGSAMVGFAFGVAWVDLAIIFTAALVADVVQLISARLTFVQPNFRSLLAVGIGGLVAAALTMTATSANYFINIVSAVIFFIPGLGIISGALELMRGNSLLGLSRLAQAAFSLLLVMIGMALAMMIIPEQTSVYKSVLVTAAFPAILAHLLGCLSTAILAATLTLYFSIERRYAFCYAVGGFIVQLSYTIATKAFAAPGYIAAFAALVILTLYAYRFKAALGCVRGSSCIPPYYVSAMIAIAVFPGVGFVRTIDGLIRITRSSVETLPMTLVSETIYYGANTAVTLAAMVFAIIITASFAEYRRDKRGVK